MSSARTSPRAVRRADSSPRAHLQVIIEGNFDASQVNGPAMKTWLAFWATSMHQPSLHRFQRINDHRLYSNLCCEFRRVLPLEDARSAARGLAALIDGLWLRGALSGDAFDTAQAQRDRVRIHGFPIGQAGEPEHTENARYLNRHRSFSAVRRRQPLMHLRGHYGPFRTAKTLHRWRVLRRWQRCHFRSHQPGER